MTDDITRPIIGIENRTPLEVFDIMCDRIWHSSNTEAAVLAGQSVVNPDAIAALKSGQRQLDMDGCEVGVSRQALDELLAGYERLAAAPSSDSPAKWGNADTVGNLIAQLRTLDPDASIQAGFHVTMPDGTNRAKVRGLHLSREHVVGNNIVNDKDVPLSYVAWAGDPTPASHTAPDVLREAASRSIQAHDASAKQPDDSDLEAAELEAIADLRAALRTTPAPADTKAEAEVLREALERTTSALDSLNRNIGAASLVRNPLGKAVRAEADAALAVARAALNQGRQA